MFCFSISVVKIYFILNLCRRNVRLGQLLEQGSPPSPEREE